MPITRRDWVYFILGGFFLTNAILGELTGGKLFAVPALGLQWAGLDEIVLSIGVIPWPVVFITTDLVNEYFGRAGVRRLTFLAVGMISYSFFMLYLMMFVPAWQRSPVSAETFHTVFGQSMWIIVGSIVAFLIAQLVDVAVFWFVRKRTGKRLLWLRATGSTAVSQLVDTFVILFIAFVVPGKLSAAEFLRLGCGNYAYKLMIAVGVTPIIYLVHGLIDRMLAKEPPGLVAGLESSGG